MLNSETRPVIGNGRIVIEVKKGRKWVEVKEVLNLGDLIHEHNLTFISKGRKVVQYSKSGRMEWGVEVSSKSKKESSNEHESDREVIESTASVAVSSVGGKSSITTG
jgi:hypothetical protein